MLLDMWYILQFPNSKSYQESEVQRTMNISIEWIDSVQQFL